MLFTLRLKRGIGPVTTALIEASSLEKATLVGKTYCNHHMNTRYVNVEPAIVADESILEPPKAEASAPRQDQALPTEKTQRKAS